MIQAKYFVKSATVKYCNLGEMIHFTLEIQYIVINPIKEINLISQTRLRFSLAHHRTDFGLVYGWSEIFPFWESRGSNFSQSALDNFLEKTISGRTQSMNKLFVNRLARLENVQATPEICNRHHRRCRSKNSAMWRNFRLNAKFFPFWWTNRLFW